jgi:cyclophilin family peptidyl-prolyl cis-trans isomerase
MTSPEARAYREAVNAPTTLERRQYELNSRIRFNHRGQVAMALGVDDHDNVEDMQPQFFITLEDAPYLDGKHVCFGTINGPTIFNALRIGRTEVDEGTHQPLDLINATRIKNVKIVENPIHQDLVPQSNIPLPWRMLKANSDNKQKDQKLKKKKKRKGKLDTNVLSFGDEFVEEENAASSVPKGMKSSHDLVQSKMLKKEVDDQVKGAALEDENNKNNEDDSGKKKKKRRRTENSDDEEEESPLEKASRLPKAANAEFSQRQSSSKSNTDPDAANTNGVTYTKKEGRDKEEEKAIQAPKEQDKRSTNGRQNVAESRNEPSVSAVEARRLKYTKGKKSKKEREEETLAKLNAFRSTVKQTVEEKKASSSSSKGQPHKQQQDDSLASRMARKAQQEAGGGSDNAREHIPTYHGQVLESDDDEEKGDQDGKSDWLATSFKCRRHIDIDSRPDIGGDGRAADEYEVVDPADRRGGRHSKSNKHQKESSRHRHGKKHHRRDR